MVLIRTKIKMGAPSATLLHIFVWILTSLRYCFSLPTLNLEVTVGKTTNWIKEDEFHSATIISLLCGYPLPPHWIIGMMELATYLGEGKRQSYGNERGEIDKFTLRSKIVTLRPF